MPLTERVDALGELVGLSRTRMNADDLSETGELLARVARRRGLSLDHTVVALAGATGSGKSTLFNALTGLPLSETGVLRPTTSEPVACAWDPAGANAVAGLLDRLGVDRWRRYDRRGLPEDEAGGGRRLDGLILVDLPDHDSRESRHRDQADRILSLVDAVVWVLDPEKYADAALHERYLRLLAGHADVTLVVLNQVDRLPEEAAEQVLDDLRRLLDDDGLAVGEHGEDGAVVLAASALTGEGVPEVRAALARIVDGRGAANRRLAADLECTVAGLRPLYVGAGEGRTRTGLDDRVREEFADRLAEAVGAAAVGAAAERDWSRAAARACGAPWERLLGVQGGPAFPEPVADGGADHTISRPVVEEAVRAVVAGAGRGLPVPWAKAVRDAARRGGTGLAEAMDAAAVRAACGPPDGPRWWAAVRAAQWALMALAVVGAVASVAVAVRGPALMPWWVPAALLVAGGPGGTVLAWAARLAARGPARRYGLTAELRLREAAAECGRARVLEPVEAELRRYREAREQYGIVTGPNSGLGGLGALVGPDGARHSAN